MSSPLNLLLDLEQRIREGGAELPASAGTAFQQAVAFEQGEVRLLIGMGEIREVIPMPPCTRLPGVKNWVVGVANLRGQILPVVDLGSFLQQTSSRSLPFHRVLVLNRLDLEVGLLVDRVIGMKQFIDTDRRMAPPEHAPAQVKDLCDGSVRVEGEDFGLFDLDGLLEKPAFRQILISQADK